MTEINLLPQRRVLASRQRRRVQGWIAAGVAYGVALVGAWSVTAAGSVETTSVAEELASVQAKLDQCERQQKGVADELKNATERERTLEFVAGHPDWSSLLELLARERGKEVVLERVTVTRPPARLSRGGQSARGTAAILVSGLAASQRVASDYVARLDGLGLFDTVVLTETRAKSVGDNASVVTFTVSCTLSDATGGKP